MQYCANFIKSSSKLHTSQQIHQARKNEMGIGKPINKARVPFSLNKYYERLRPLMHLAKHSLSKNF